MNYSNIKNKCFNKKFLVIFIGIFVILFIIFAVLKFIGQLPILIILAFFVAYYFNEYLLQKNYNIFSPDEQKNILTKIIKEGSKIESNNNENNTDNEPVYEEFYDGSWERV
jgi:hypothetical protein